MAQARIHAGVCGFETTVTARSDDRRHVTLDLATTCPDGMRTAKDLRGRSFDASAKIGPCRRPGGLYETAITRLCNRVPHVACPVPAGICKAVEVAAGLAPPRDAHIRGVADSAADTA